VKLDKKTRKALYEAAPKTTEITWPQDAPFPSWGHRYQVYGDEGNYLFTMRLEGSHKGAYETKATVRIDSDPSRVLPGLKGIRTEQGAYETEPERVDRGYEDRLAMTGSAKTVIKGAEHRFEAKKRGHEQKLHNAGKNGFSKTVKTLERVGKAA
jgi:hypothetical protein